MSSFGLAIWPLIRRGFELGAAIGLVAVMSWLVTYLLERPPIEPDIVTVAALCTALLSAVLLLASPGLPVLGFVGVYGTYLALAHLGAVGAQLLLEDALAGYTYRHWFESDGRPLAVALSGLGIGAFVLGARVLGGGSRPRPNRVAPLEGRGDHGLYLVGVALLAYCAAYMTLAVGTGALPLFESYASYRRAMGGLFRDNLLLSYGMMLFFLASGLAFVLATGDRRQRTIGLLLFLCPAGLLMLTGNRGEVLYPVAAGLAVYSARGYRPRLKALALFAAVFFVMIPVVRQVRSVGLGSFEARGVSIDVIEPFVSLGYTLRPVVITANWIEGGEPFALGQTYTLPIQRVVGLLIPGVTRPEFQGNPHYIKGRTEGTGMGYSVIAEAYFNFGVAGVVIILASLGAALARFGDRAPGGRSLAVAGAIMAILVNNIRNAFGFVPGQVFLVSLLFLAGLLIGRARAVNPASVNSRPIRLGNGVLRRRGA